MPCLKVGGTITDWEVAVTDATPVGIGWRLTWSAIVNGEGSGADPDLMVGTIGAV